MSRFRWMAIALLGLLASPLFVQAQPGTSPGMHVDQDLVITRDLDVAGDIVVHAPSTLTVQGARVTWTGNLTVEPGAAVILAPGSAEPRLQGIGPGATIWVHGTLRGTNSSIAGLAGNDLDPYSRAVGGMQVTGTLDLLDSRVEASTGFVSGHPGSIITLARTTLTDLGDALLVSRGQVQILDAVLDGGRLFGLVLRDSCTAQVERTEIRSPNLPLLVSGCNARLDGVTIPYASTGITVNGAADVDLSNSTVSDYAQFGLRVRALPSGPPAVTVTNTTFTPRPTSRMGIWSEGARPLVMKDVALDGHAEHGLYAASSILDTEDVSARSNGQYGFDLVQSQFDQDQLNETNFGNRESGSENGYAPVRARIVVQASVAGEEESDALELAVHDGSGTLAGNTTIHPPAPGQLTLDLFENSTGEAPRYLGPFTYTASWPDGTTLEGQVNPSNPLLVFQSNEKIDWSRWIVWGLAAGVLGAAGLLWRQGAGRRS